MKVTCLDCGAVFSARASAKQITCPNCKKIVILKNNDRGGEDQ